MTAQKEAPACAQVLPAVHFFVDHLNSLQQELVAGPVARREAAGKAGAKQPFLRLQ